MILILLLLLGQLLEFFKSFYIFRELYLIGLYLVLEICKLCFLL